jgi:hypothetical protein
MLKIFQALHPPDQIPKGVLIDTELKCPKFKHSLARKEMQIKTTLRFFFTLVRMATNNITNNNQCWRG